MDREFITDFFCQVFLPRHPEGALPARIRAGSEELNLLWDQNPPVMRYSAVYDTLMVYQNSKGMSSGDQD